MTTLKLNGKEYTVKYTMATAISMQRETGISSFGLGDLDGDNRIDAMLAMAAQMLTKAGHQCTKESLADEIDSMEVMTQVMMAVNDEINHFFAAKEGDDKPEPVEDDEQKKNY